MRPHFMHRIWAHLEDARIFRSVNVERYLRRALQPLQLWASVRMVFHEVRRAFFSGPWPGGSRCAARMDNRKKHPLQPPRTIYHATKLAAEDLVRRAA